MAFQLSRIKLAISKFLSYSVATLFNRYIKKSDTVGYQTFFKNMLDYTVTIYFNIWSRRHHESEYITFI